MYNAPKLDAPTLTGRPRGRRISRTGVVLALSGWGLAVIFSVLFWAAVYLAPPAHWPALLSNLF